MNALRNLFPHSHTFFPGHSRQTRNINGTSHCTPEWYSDRESFRRPGNLARHPMVDDGIGALLHGCNSPPPSSPRQRHQQQKRRSGYECNRSLSADEMQNMRNRRTNEKELFTRRRTEDLLRRRNNSNEIFQSRVRFNDHTGIPNRERERERERKREVELNIQRRIEGTMDIQAQMQEAVFQEEERIDYEWRCVERAWEVLEVKRDRDRRDRRREREFVDWVESFLDAEGGVMGVDCGGRGYRRWDDGRWEDLGGGGGYMGGY